VFLSFDLSYWLKHGITPIWLEVYGESASRGSDKHPCFAALDSLRTTEPPMLYESLNGRPMVPILLPVGVERQRVVASIVEQVERIAPMIAHLGRVQSQLTSEPLQSVDVTDIERVAPDQSEEDLH
jgi:hypothetical protein